MFILIIINFWGSHGLEAFNLNNCCNFEAMIYHHRLSFDIASYLPSKEVDWLPYKTRCSIELLFFQSLRKTSRLSNLFANNILKPMHTIIIINQLHPLPISSYS